MYRPQSLLTGMNRFLASLEITFRRDPTNFRPRVNKANSIKDREQKGPLSLKSCFFFGHSDFFCSIYSLRKLFLLRRLKETRIVFPTLLNRGGCP